MTFRHEPTRRDKPSIVETNHSMLRDSTLRDQHRPPQRDTLFWFQPGPHKPKRQPVSRQSELRHGDGTSRVPAAIAPAQGDRPTQAYAVHRDTLVKAVSARSDEPRSFDTPPYHGTSRAFFRRTKPRRPANASCPPSRRQAKPNPLMETCRTVIWPSAATCLANILRCPADPSRLALPILTRATLQDQSGSSSPQQPPILI